LDAIGPSPWYTAIQGHLSTIVPDDEIDMLPMISCFNDCSTANIANCQSMPVIQSSSGSAYAWPAAPVTFAAADCAGWAPGNAWYDAIVTNVKLGGPSCDLSADEWLDQTRQSAIEAQNQVVKFEKRRNFLEGRAAEAANIISLFNEAITKIEAFLLGPAANLIRARIDFDPNTGGGLPYEAIYGWQNAERLPMLTRGRWHIVKVEARIPNYCDNRCSTNQGPSSPPWPKIITYTKNWGMKRCYELVNTEGSVKFRTTRYDEEIKSGSILFPNFKPLWKFRSHHPERPGGGFLYDPGPLDGLCVHATIQDFADGNTASGIYDGAFMMNNYIQSPDPGFNEGCWDLSHRLLSRGVVNETCANYFWDAGTSRMDLRFVRCLEF